jgi:N-acetylmuramoyl-L-alanine amidase-like protein
MSFSWDIRHWATVEAFEAHLSHYDPAICAWVEGLTIHHTAIPTVAQWRGRRSVEVLGRFYRAKGWSGGPHLFIGPDGIWQGTPLNLPGIHAIGANGTRWGVEFVGNYTHVGWAEPIHALGLGAVAALLRWRKLGVSPHTVDGHRNYNKPSCPGDAINLDTVRAELGRMLAPAPAPAPVAGLLDQDLTIDSAILSAPRATLEQCIRYVTSMPHGEYTRDEIASVILSTYFDLCLAVGVDPLVVVAQAVHESANFGSWWAARPQRNPAGIGVDGRPGVGVRFASWKNDSIPAHVGRLLAYALAPRAANDAQAALIAKALQYRSLNAAYRGVAPTLRGLGGRWAESPTYGARIARVGNEIRRA